MTLSGISYQNHSQEDLVNSYEALEVSFEDGSFTKDEYKARVKALTKALNRRIKLDRLHNLN